VLPLQCRQARRLFAYARGRTDFRGLQASYAHRQDGFVFCALEASGRVPLENELALCIADAYPVTPWPQPGDPAAARGGPRWAGNAHSGAPLPAVGILAAV
jgi:hypothetical protein